MISKFKHGEYDALMKSKKWSMVPHRDSINVVTYHWVHKVKKNLMFSSEYSCKNGLFAKGYNQGRLDYSEIISTI